MTPETEPEPEQPANWPFVDELKTPDTVHFRWTRSKAKSSEADLCDGVTIEAEFPDPEGVLDSAYDHFRKFAQQAGLNGKQYRIITSQTKDWELEAFEILVSKEQCRITAGDREGIRRAIYFLEDTLLANNGPFLKTGRVYRRSWLKTRISRCLFGPIQRPPLNRDELLDSVDYYPDAYLERLAHEGVNALWLTIKFCDLCKTFATPDAGKDAEKRLAKLRDTVKKCSRFGIKIYIFCIEPAHWQLGEQALMEYPALGGVKIGHDVLFCPFSKLSQTYLFESVYSIFKSVPGLGGMINISHGERLTTCLSSIWTTEDKTVNCSVCSKKQPWEILHSSLSAMEKGMHAAAPEAQLISWLYLQLSDKAADWVVELAAHTPERVTLQLNFESGGTMEQLEKPRPVGDYWLSYAGPSERFTSMAEKAFASQTEISAKLQVGCSLEIATVPYVPVPSLLYRKYKRMRELHVSSVMQCWYWGSDPGLMNRAAGTLAFEEFSDGEGNFLLRLARPDWGPYAEQVVEAWQCFSDSFSNYPMSLAFQYYGPMHDGIVWPLYLFPVGKPLAQTWQIYMGTSGDAIGECLDNHSFKEAIRLCDRMSQRWTDGVKIMNRLRRHCLNNQTCLKEINLAEAIGTLFASGSSILHFYALREQLYNASETDKHTILSQMEAIVIEEIRRSTQMISYCQFDSRLGFNSEAEGYKFTPEKLQWRIRKLEQLLASDFPRAHAHPFSSQLEQNTVIYDCTCGSPEDCGSFKWRGTMRNQNLVLEIDCKDKGNPDQFFITILFKNQDLLVIDLYESGRISFSKAGCSRRIFPMPVGWKSEVIIPLQPNTKAASLSIVRIKNNKIDNAWGGNPLPYRLLLGVYNPAEMGSLLIET